MKMKSIALGTALSMALLAGCSSENGGQDTDEAKKAEQTEQKEQTDQTDQTDQAKQRERVEQVEHMHGLAYSSDGKFLYLATHEGLIQSSDQGASWTKAGTENIDFMGFQALPDGTMVTSGHPGEGSHLPNPLGFMISEDEGESWKPVSLQGKVDFHTLVANEKQPDIIYGIIQMGEGEYAAGIYRSPDRGRTWERMASKGLPDDLHKVISLYSDSENPDRLVAGTQEGVLESKDAGQNWAKVDNSRILTAMESGGEAEMIGYAITNQERGFMISKDGGLTWEKIGLDLGEKDAVAYLSVNPTNPNEIAAATFESSVYITQDGGKNWTSVIEQGSMK